MIEDEMHNEIDEEKWFIDLNWFQLNNRSFPYLATRCLCADCQKKLKSGEAEATPAKLITAVKDCCSKKTGYITGESPLLESVFRILLSNGNQPLNIAEIGEKLRTERGGGTGSSAGAVLKRLLMNDRYYGLSPYPD